MNDDDWINIPPVIRAALRGVQSRVEASNGKIETLQQQNHELTNAVKQWAAHCSAMESELHGDVKTLKSGVKDVTASHFATSTKLQDLERTCSRLSASVDSQLRQRDTDGDAKFTRINRAISDTQTALEQLQHSGTVAESKFRMFNDELVECKRASKQTQANCEAEVEELRIKLTDAVRLHESVAARVDKQLQDTEAARIKGEDRLAVQVSDLRVQHTKSARTMEKSITEGQMKAQTLHADTRGEIAALSNRVSAIEQDQETVSDKMDSVKELIDLRSAEQGKTTVAVATLRADLTGVKDFLGHVEASLKSSIDVGQEIQTRLTAVCRYVAGTNSITMPKVEEGAFMPSPPDKRAKSPMGGGGSGDSPRSLYEAFLLNRTQQSGSRSPQQPSASSAPSSASTSPSAPAAVSGAPPIISVIERHLAKRHFEPLLQTVQQLVERSAYAQHMDRAAEIKPLREDVARAAKRQEEAHEELKQRVGGVEDSVVQLGAECEGRLRDSGDAIVAQLKVALEGGLEDVRHECQGAATELVESAVQSLQEALQECRDEAVAVAADAAASAQESVVRLAATVTEQSQQLAETAQCLAEHGDCLETQQQSIVEHQGQLDQHATEMAAAAEQHTTQRQQQATQQEERTVEVAKQMMQASRAEMCETLSRDVESATKALEQRVGTVIMQYSTRSVAQGDKLQRHLAAVVTKVRELDVELGGDGDDFVEAYAAQSDVGTADSEDEQREGDDGNKPSSPNRNLFVSHTTPSPPKQRGSKQQLQLQQSAISSPRGRLRDRVREDTLRIVDEESRRIVSEETAELQTQLRSSVAAVQQRQQHAAEEVSAQCREISSDCKRLVDGAAANIMRSGEAQASANRSSIVEEVRDLLLHKVSVGGKRVKLHSEPQPLLQDDADALSYDVSAMSDDDTGGNEEWDSDQRQEDGASRGSRRRSGAKKDGGDNDSDKAPVAVSVTDLEAKYMPAEAVRKAIDAAVGDLQEAFGVEVQRVGDISNRAIAALAAEIDSFSHTLRQTKERMDEVTMRIAEKMSFSECVERFHSRDELDDVLKDKADYQTVFERISTKANVTDVQRWKEEAQREAISVLLPLVENRMANLQHVVDEKVDLDQLRTLLGHRVLSIA